MTKTNCNSQCLIRMKLRTVTLGCRSTSTNHTSAKSFGIVAKTRRMRLAELCIVNTWPVTNEGLQESPNHPSLARKILVSKIVGWVATRRGRRMIARSPSGVARSSPISRNSDFARAAFVVRTFPLASAFRASPSGVLQGARRLACCAASFCITRLRPKKKHHTTSRLCITFSIKSAVLLIACYQLSC